MGVRKILDPQRKALKGCMPPTASQGRVHTLSAVIISTRLDFHVQNVVHNDHEFYNRFGWHNVGVARL